MVQLCELRRRSDLCPASLLFELPAHQAAGRMGIRCHSHCANTLVTSFGRDAKEPGHRHRVGKRSLAPRRECRCLQHEVHRSASWPLCRTPALVGSPVCVAFPLLQSEHSTALPQGLLGPWQCQHLRGAWVHGLASFFLTSCPYNTQPPCPHL